MKRIYLFISLFFFFLSSLSYALEPLDTQFRSSGQEIHLIKTTLKDGILTIYLMVENQTDERIDINNINVNEVQYIADGRRYPILKDANNKWIASPMGAAELFNSRSYDGVRVEAGKSILGWMKFEAPAEDVWPIELNLPETLPFTIEKPNL